MGDTALVLLAFSDHYWIQQPDQNWSPEAFPNTLAEFKDWWNVIDGERSYKAAFPRTLAMKSARTTSPSGGLTFVEGKPKKTLDQITLPLQFGGETGLEYFAFGYGQGALMYHLPIKRFIYVEIKQQTLANYFRRLLKNHRQSTADA